MPAADAPLPSWGGARRGKRASQAHGASSCHVQRCSRGLQALLSYMLTLSCIAGAWLQILMHAATFDASTLRE